MKIARQILRAITLLSLAASLLTIGMTADWADLPFVLIAIIILGALMCAPFLIVLFISRRLKLPISLYFMSVLSLAMLGFWLYVYGSVFVWNETSDAQDGLIFAVIPIYGILAACIVGQVIAFIDERAAKSATPHNLS